MFDRGGFRSPVPVAARNQLRSREEPGALLRSCHAGPTGRIRASEEALRAAGAYQVCRSRNKQLNTRGNARNGELDFCPSIGQTDEAAGLIQPRVHGSECNRTPSYTKLREHSAHSTPVAVREADSRLRDLKRCAKSFRRGELEVIRRGCRSITAMPTEQEGIQIVALRVGDPRTGGLPIRPFSINATVCSGVLIMMV